MHEFLNEWIDRSPLIFITLFFAIPFIVRFFINKNLLEEHEMGGNIALIAPYIIWVTFEELRPEYHKKAIFSNIIAAYFAIGFLFMLWPVIAKSFQQ